MPVVRLSLEDELCSWRLLPWPLDSWLMLSDNLYVPWTVCGICFTVSKVCCMHLLCQTGP